MSSTGANNSQPDSGSNLNLLDSISPTDATASNNQAQPSTFSPFAGLKKKAALAAGIVPGGNKVTAINKTSLSSTQKQQQQQHFDAASGASLDAASAGASTTASSSMITPRIRKVYCILICILLWMQMFRLLSCLAVEKSLLSLDIYYLKKFKLHFLIPAVCISIQSAAVSLIFIRNNGEFNWLVPFYSSKDYLIRSRSNFRPKMDDYKRRINGSIIAACIMATISSISMIVYLTHRALESESSLHAYLYGGDSLLSSSSSVDALMKQPATLAPTVTVAEAAGSAGATTTPAPVLTPAQEEVLRMKEALWTIALLAFDCVWAVYATFTCFLVSFCFNLICSLMRERFHSIRKIIEDLAESDTTKTTNQARKITTLYLEHNEACELLDESNDFWQYLIFFTYFTYIPAYCYCLYSLFFVDFEVWSSAITWVIQGHTGFIILLVSFSAAGVSTETAAACASYFLIVADFSRSSVFSANQNGTTAAASNASPTQQSALTSPTNALHQ